ncbi:alpha/beta hydrolase [Natronosporangium hydrolyticum]|uniref:Alpha/beta hydrolase n=1 Tax=Natronosporangium hydrolyticum TaxID=2811111 RepID=A0A895YFM1_9ACTN|nr:alpha/beta hydrolase [Natronosporangium hydrolyticum]QSB14259.1 alpha/beta hydrolase [Natronosporangium hydrolyticum]
MTESTITDSGVPIVVADFDGAGAPLLLLHGAGSNLAALRPLATALTSRHRVVAVDLRGHGRSGDGPWTWDAVLGDLAAVVKALALDPPAVVGHSLGGMVAAHWASHHHDCPGVINLDGNPSPTHPEQLAGMDPADAEEALRRLHDTFAAMAAAMSAPLTDEQLAAAEAAQQQVAQRYGEAGQALVDGFRRSLRRQADGTTRLRPGADTVAALQTAIASFDLLGAYRRATAPALHLLATEDLPEQQAFGELYAAYRTGLRRDLAAIAAQRPELRVQPLPGASHALAAEHPARLAALISAFLAGEPLPAWDG